MTNDIKVCNGLSFEEHRFFSVGHNFYFSPALSPKCTHSNVSGRQFSLSNN